MPSSAARRRAAATLTSATPASRAVGTRRLMIRAWSAPIRPTPTMPIPTRALTGTAALLDPPAGALAHSTETLHPRLGRPDHCRLAGSGVLPRTEAPRRGLRTEAHATIRRACDPDRPRWRFALTAGDDQYLWPIP